MGEERKCESVCERECVRKREREGERVSPHGADMSHISSQFSSESNELPILKLISSHTFGQFKGEMK